MSPQDNEEQVPSVSYAYITGVIEPADDEDGREIRMVWHPPTEDGQPHACGHEMGWAHPVFLDSRNGLAIEAPDDFEIPPEMLMALDAALLDLHADIDKSLHHEIEGRG